MPFDNSSHDHGSSDDSRTIEHTTVNRRRYLQLAGAGLLAGAAGVPSVAASDDEYDVVLDVVDDLGADNTGSEPINDALAAATADVEYDFSHYAPAQGWPMPAIDEIDFDDGGVKVIFPEGEYVIEAGARGFGFTRWGISPAHPEEQQFLGKLALVGEGDGDAILRPAEGGRHPIFTLWGRDLRIENFTVDQTVDDTSSGITVQGSDQLVIKDIHFDGKVTGDYVETPHWQDPEYDPSVILDDPFCVGPGVFGRDGTGVIENVRAPDGVQPFSRKGGCWVTFHHAGDLLFQSCEFSNFSDNAIYASPPGQHNGQEGSVRVENCHFENNNITAIRLGSPGSYAKDCTVVTEEGEIPATPWGAITSRAGWIWHSFDGTYENIDVVHDHPNGEGILEHWSHHGSLEVVNSRFELNRDGRHAVRYLQGGDEVRLNNVHVAGDAGTGSALLLGNCDATVNNLRVTQSGADRDGISFQNATGMVNNPSIDVTGEAIVADGESDVTVRNHS